MNQADLSDAFLQEKKEKEEESKRDYSKLFKIYLLPIIAIGIFLSIIIFGVLDSVQDVFSSVQEIEEAEEEITNTSNFLNQLNNLQQESIQIQSDLDILNQLAPASITEVSNFQSRVSEIANTSGLESQNERSNDSDSVNIDSAGRLDLQEVPNNFEFRGNLSQIFNFFDALSNLNDFVVVENLEMQQGDEDIWQLNITLTKYQFDVITNDLSQLFLNVPVTSDVAPDVQQYINDRR